MSHLQCTTLKSTSVSVCFRGISRLPSAFAFLRWFKLAHISIQVCTFQDGCKQGIDQQIFNRKSISRTITHPQSLFEQGLRMRNCTWNRFPIKNLLIDSLLTPIVESTYLQCTSVSVWCNVEERAVVCRGVGVNGTTALKIQGRGSSKHRRSQEGPKGSCPPKNFWKI